MTNTHISFLFLFAFLCFQAQEISDKEAFAKCKKEFSKKICLSDEDKDSVLFYLDHCPKYFGEKENDGCPWPDTDSDGVLDKDDACPTVPGIIEENGCKSYKPHIYSQEELDKVKEDFLEKSKNIDYNKLADFIFSKLGEKDFENKIINLQIATFSQMPGCGLDRQDYSPLNLRVNLASEMFWNERNFKKFVNKYPNKIIVVYSQKEEIQKKIQSYKNLFSKKVETLTFYNSINNFKNLNIKEIDFYKSFSINIFISENNELSVRININSYEPKKYFGIKYETKLNKYVEIK